MIPLWIALLTAAPGDSLWSQAGAPSNPAGQPAQNNTGTSQGQSAPAAATQASGQTTATMPATSILDRSVPLGADKRVTGIYRVAAPPRKGAVVIIPETGQTADSNRVIGPLRQSLPRHGWSSLALNQNPAADIPLPKLMETALAFLEQEKHKRISVIAYGRGADEMLPVLQLSTQIKKSALVLISVNWTQNLDVLMNLPVLDVAGSRDHVDVVRAARHRRQWMQQQGASRYNQRIFTGAAHDYSGGVEDDLLRHVRGWLKRVLMERS